MRASLAIAVASLMALVVPLAALAQDYEQHWRRCTGKEGVGSDERIRSCTIVIESGRENEIGTATAFHNRGIGYEQKKQWPQAIEQFSEAIRRNPPNVLALIGRGYAYASSGKADLAIADYDAALRLQPSNVFALVRRAAANFNSGRHAAALRDYSEVHRLAPANPSALSGICITGAILGKLEQAMEACEQTLRLSPRNPQAIYSRAIIHLKAGRLDEAIAGFTDALSIEQYAPMLYGRGVAKARKGDVEGSRADFASARFMQPDIDREMSFYGF